MFNNEKQTIWKQKGGSFVAPTGATKVKIFLKNASTVASVAYFDEIWLGESSDRVLVEQTQDYYPYGSAMRQYTSSVSTENVSKFKYQGKERDAESGYDYFEARLFDSQTIRFYHVDPMAERFANTSPYVGMNNNPMRIIDPSGMVYGEYYDSNLKKIGDDGEDDNKKYVVTKKEEVTKITETDGKVEKGTVDSALELPGKSVINAMENAVNESNSPSDAAGDSKGGLHETGGMFGKVGGEGVAVPANPGKMPSEGDETAHVNVNDSVSPAPSGFKKEGSYHVHFSGTLPNGKGSVQQPSPGDREVKGFKTSYVIMAKYGTIHILGSRGETKTVVPMNAFFKLGH